MKLKITVHGVAYEVDVEVLDAKDEMHGSASPLPPPPAATPAAAGPPAPHEARLRVEHVAVGGRQPGVLPGERLQQAETEHASCTQCGQRPSAHDPPRGNREESHIRQ